jgi:glycine/D-amino acid oxidase-like deaminating enzyme
VTAAGTDHESATDVLVVGGGLAATWTALAAAQAGGEVVLVDKGYCVTSGVTATAGVTHWIVPPEGHERAVTERHASAGGLAESEWALRGAAHDLGTLADVGPLLPLPGRGRQDRPNPQRARSGIPARDARPGTPGGCPDSGSPSGDRVAAARGRFGRRCRRGTASSRRHLAGAGRRGGAGHRRHRVPVTSARFTRQHRGRALDGRRSRRAAVGDGILQLLHARTGLLHHDPVDELPCSALISTPTATN